MAAHLPHAGPLKVGEHDLGSHGSYAPTLERAWDAQMTYTLYDLRDQIVTFMGVHLRQDDRRVAFVFSLMDRHTADYPASFTVPAGWHVDGQGWVVVELRLEVPVSEGDDHRATSAGTSLDATSDDATGNLDLHPAVDASVALMAHVYELTSEND